MPCIYRSGCKRTDKVSKQTMPVTLICPRLTCRALLCVPEKVRGKRVRCTKCGTTLIVPELPGSKRPHATPAEKDPSSRPS